MDILYKQRLLCGRAFLALGDSEETVTASAVIRLSSLSAEASSVQRLSLWRVCTLGLGEPGKCWGLPCVGGGGGGLVFMLAPGTSLGSATPVCGSDRQVLSAWHTWSISAAQLHCSSE